jgi:pSer/pThr/pTyr-binding forkhead associated (FHA) protein
MQQFRLRYRAHDIELLPGEFVIGRSEDCQLSLDDAMISRRHALLRVSHAGVVVADLGSRNGVSVNGEKVREERRLADGDRITVGKHELILLILQPDSVRTRGPLARTLGPVELSDLDAAVHGRPQYTPTTGTARAMSSFATLSQLADKAFAMGRPEEAERLLTSPLSELTKEIQKGANVDPAVIARFAGAALRLATELQKATWVEWILIAYQNAGQFVPATIIDALLVLAPKLKHLGRKSITDYVSVMQQAASLTANERFLLQRLESLAKRLGTIP